MPRIAFIDTETDLSGKKVLDIGGIRSDGVTFHGASISSFVDFLHGSDFACGHNILNHDLKYVGTWLMNAGIRPENVIDTLYLSPLLFPKKPYHALLKDDKLQTDELNNPLNDSIKAKDLFNDEVAAFLRLDDEIKRIYFKLIGSTREFKAFFDYIGNTSETEDQNRGLFSRIFQAFTSRNELSVLIAKRFSGKICENAKHHSRDSRCTGICSVTHRHLGGRKFRKINLASMGAEELSGSRTNSIQAPFFTMPARMPLLQ